MENKIKFKLILNIIIISLFIIVFFFKIIPIPVENAEGIKNTDKFIFGGFYYTSILYQIEVNNIFSVLCFTLIFSTLFITNNYLFKKEVDNNGIHF